MPYKKVSELPDGVKELPAHAQDIYLNAFNSAFKQYDGDEAKSNATAWAAVKTKYEKKDDKWVAKEAHVKESGLSMEDKRNLIQKAIEQKIPSQPSSLSSKEIAWVVDIFDTELVYRFDGTDYKASYVISEDGKVTIGEPQKVKRQTIYTPMESLRRVYQDIIQEVGKRNASSDSARIKKIVELCQELLSSEPVGENNVAEALKEAESTLVWIKEQAVMKTEDGVKFPAAAFAYVPDTEKPSEWKLRLWEDPDKEVTRKQLGAAAAALSPGGFRGNRVEIPKEDLPAVKRKIRSAYRSLDISDEDMPRWIKEATMRTLLTGYIPLTEAKVDKGVAKITVIKAGFNSSKDRFYPGDMLAKDYKVFEGLKMYADHPSEFDENNRPERSIRDWVATLKNVQSIGNTVIGEAHIVEPWMQEKLATLRDKGMLSEMGISINAVGTATEAEIEGVKTNYIEHITRGRSVDFVTEAGAGGLVEMYEAERDSDIDFVTLSIFKERRPDLVKEIETETKNTLLKEVKKTMDLEQENKELKESVSTLTQERDNLKTEKEAAEKASRIAETKATVEDAIGKAELPEPAKARILERFKDAEKAEGLEEAIKAEQDYIAAINESGKVKGLGESHKEEDGSKALRESFKRANPEWTDIQLDAAVRGR